MKKKRKLWLQVLAVSIVFYVAGMILGAVAMYSSSRNAYLSAKNDMISHDLERICNFISADQCFCWYFDYAKTHADEIRNNINTDYSNLVSQITTFNSEKEAIDYYNSLPAEQQLATAVDRYFFLQSQMNYESTVFGYGGLFCIDVSEDNEGFLFYEAGKFDENYELKDSDTGLGQKWKFYGGDHPAIEKLRSGDYETAAFELARSDQDDSSYYIGYMPVTVGGKIKAAFGIDYNWDDFHTQLLNEVRIMIGIMFLGMVVSCALLMLVINRIAIKPLSIVQHAVRDYIKVKDNETAEKQLDRVKSKNEIGVLSDDINALVREMHSYTANIKTLTKEVMEALAHTIDAKDRYTNGHSFRVARYSRMLAEELGLSKQEQEDIYYMGLLHDIGKIGIPNSIINKPSRLTEEEYEIVKKHPVYGYEILSEIKSMPELSTGARCHHERLDGSGYPDGLSGEQIPYMARIIAVADSYDTMTSNRSYRQYLPQAVVRSEIEKNIGTQFDPAPAAAMLKIIDADKDYQLHG